MQMLKFRKLPNGGYECVGLRYLEKSYTFVA